MLKTSTLLCGKILNKHLVSLFYGIGIFLSLGCNNDKFGSIQSSVTTPITPPNLSICDNVTCENLPKSMCSSAGFKITLTDFSSGNTNDGGSATYTYQICSPLAGVCTGGNGIRAGEACLDNGFCQRKGQTLDPGARCSRDCAADTFRGLSHYDVTFPELGTTCLSQNTQVTGTCTAVDNTTSDGHAASVGNFVLGDGSCFSPTSPVAKCDNTDINPGDCITMTVTIAGELNGLGSGASVVVDKESTTCTASCIAGPSCTPCNPTSGGMSCLTRTLGFWGTHPWITNNYGPVTVCGKPLDCSGADNGKSNPSCLAGSCHSIMEGLGSIPSELPTNQPYVAMIRQLTAAKLNLNATATLGDGATCSTWSYGNKSIQQWIGYCEGLCSASKSTIAGSGCIEALDAFNNSTDTGFSVTPAPFDRPSIDDQGNVSGADPTQFKAAQKNGYVVGKNQCQ